ncbi:MAG: hypothetical protein ACLR8P_01725 [Clostridium fessum]
MIYYTPYARVLYEEEGKSTEAYDRAARLCIRANQGYGFRTGGDTGWVETRRLR